MPHALFNPRTHVFNYGVPTHGRERYALDEFCKELRHRYRASYKIVPTQQALRRGLVVEVDGATVDGVLRTSRGMVAVELLGYSPICDRGDVMARDFEFRKEVKRALYNQLQAKCYALTFWYREGRRGGQRPNTVRTVPPTTKFRAVITELRSVLAAVPGLEFNKFLSVRFYRSDHVQRIDRRRSFLALDAAQFPCCANYFEHVRLQGLKPWMTPEVNSDLKCGAIGIDEGWVREYVLGKVAKCNKSHLRANGLPIWLIVHSDGHAIHQTIPRPHRARAIDVCRRALAQTEHSFKRVYWADRTGFLDGAWVGRVL